MPIVKEVSQLNKKLRAVEPYPAGICSFPEQVKGTTFFPGGQGLWFEASQEEMPNFPRNGVMVLGQDYDTLASYKNTLALSKNGNIHPAKKSPTWTNLLNFLKDKDVDIPPQDCFFTNLFMGLRESGKSTGTFPGAKDKKFVHRCLDFLETQITIQRPSLILTLGNIVPYFIAERSETLAPWRKCRTFAEYDKQGPVMHDVRFQNIPNYPCSVVILTHPSMRLANVGRRKYGEIKGNKAEIAMVKEARTYTSFKETKPGE